MSEIILTPGATAEPNTCGSCRFFNRNPTGDGEQYRMNGICVFKFPPKMPTPWDIRRIDPKYKDDEYTGTEMWIKDTDSCDLYKPDGKYYIIQRRICTA
jgi:hypothetical protein